ncbi:GDP-mannose 4,6-dehydratase [candidate division KSB1 bacterium]|nr:GDP-mannose 4,6-dehydratase [candidate division KSB1 bacterium]
MHILLTGGAGFIGSHLCEKLLSQHHRVDCLDNFNEFYDPNIKRKNVAAFSSNKNYRLLEGDILDWSFVQDVFQSNTYDLVVHLAARAGVRPSIQQPLLYEKVNVQGTLHLLDLCRQYRVGKMVFASSSSVYGNNNKVPFSESDPVDYPISPYAATKKAGELACYTYHHLYGLDITCLRFFTVYGPRQRPDMAIHKFARLIYTHQPLPVFGDGSSRRDYTYIQDIIQGVMAAIETCKGYHIYNLGESKTVELRYLIELLEQTLDRKAVIQYLPEQPGDVAITYADISLARTELNYDPRTNIEDGVHLFAAWVKDAYVQS